MLSMAVWQNGGETVYRRLVGQVPWDFREKAATEAIDALVARLIPDLQMNQPADGGVIAGDYVAWVIGAELDHVLGQHQKISARDGGYVFVNLTKPARRPVCLHCESNHGAQFAAHAESVVIIQAEPNETKDYSFVNITEYTNGVPLYLGDGRASKEQKATNYRLLVWVVEVKSGRITARTVITPDPLPESFRIEDEDRHEKNIDGELREVIHRHVKAYEDTFPKLTAWLENHRE